MKDFGRSDHPDVQAQLARLATLSLPDGRLGLDTIRVLLHRLGDPQDRLPPTFHVAGTNGKGSTCAFLRAILEADGKRVHVTTSPHLVRYNERIRVAGKLIDDDTLAAALAEVLENADGLTPSFFEVTIAAAFLTFARAPADACIVEVGLGGRLDATNVLRGDVLTACGIVSLGLDHERFLLRAEDGVPSAPLARIAFEKAGIAKAGVPLVTLAYPPEADLEVEPAAMTAGALHVRQDRNWSVSHDEAGLFYCDRHGELALPLPVLPGAHQVANAALAIAMLRHQDRVSVRSRSYADGLHRAHWPARLQRLRSGPLIGTRTVWLDGGHNPDAGRALAAHFEGERLHLVLGMIAGKDPAAIVAPLAACCASLTVVPVPGHEHHPAAAFGEGATPAGDVREALAAVPDDGLPVLIAGSLYLAGDVLACNGEVPD